MSTKLSTKKQNPRNPCGYEGLWWYLQESNQGHTDFQSVALPTELRYQALLSGCKYNFKIRIYKQNPEKKVLIFFNCRPL